MVFQSAIARLRTGFAIAKASFGVLRREKWLLAFPILYGFAVIVGLVGLLAGLVVVVFGSAIGVAALESVAVDVGGSETVTAVLGLVGSFLFLFAATAVATFFSAALVHSVGKLFAGEPTGVRDGLAGAWESKRTIFAWGFVGAAVGMVFRALESQEGKLAATVRAIAGFAWFAMTFFIVPVIVFRDSGVRESMHDSVTLFRETWGEVGGISLGIGLVTIAAAIPVLGLGIGAPVFLLETPGTVLPYTIGPTVALLVGIALVHNAATAIAKTALYRYADAGELPPAFDGIDPDDLVRSRRRSRATMGGGQGSQPGKI
ncbi:DUF6159 family protein [Natronobacterium gregoryi]|uniref:Glycerophosphoryl diester phosphodiesterase membrane domain-containing protein n=2 Tax=Natronobacterium gregoryi TaxID=44930 RepID=L0AG15_NATGS|nr:DUF6159 family protein [Natronobacterium gregoryi]AFZ72746.1 hypothetical protein Natgr_1540 [Natronobacterium gregoryi SP2]ELY69488.1 hypothetical protein C490_08189 [Natronobacterium gregoryi SP2]PLK21089.1 hypothetical protein CYV19_06020 [Natronobacterium gregoryi SP2]SFJ68791.1 hypothetical protein SAMN05443661_15812 [Natronobacterium gregoryi]